MVDRCVECGADMDLVGRRHLCVPRSGASDPVVRPTEMVTPEISPKRGRPRLGASGKTLRATEPWKALGMSRATWYARRREDRKE